MRKFDLNDRVPNARLSRVFMLVSSLFFLLWLVLSGHGCGNMTSELLIAAGYISLFKSIRYAHPNGGLALFNDFMLGVGYIHFADVATQRMSNGWVIISLTILLPLVIYIKHRELIVNFIAVKLSRQHGTREKVRRDSEHTEG